MSDLARRTSFVSVTAVVLLGVLLAGCHDAAIGGGVTAVYTVPASLAQLAQETFFDQPWPSDLRLENGSPRFEGYYNPNSLPILDTYIDSVKGLLDGFSPAGAGYLRFTGAIDPQSLPANPKAGLDKSASVQLIDIDPASPERGQRKLCSLKWREAVGVYYVGDVLAFMPTVGFPLRVHTKYALVVTDALRAHGGDAVEQSATVAQLLGVTAPDATTSAANATLAPAVREIESAGVPRANIVHFAVFTTADPTQELIAVRDGVAKTVAAPVAEPTQWTRAFAGASFTEYQGRYGPSPNYQAGTLPFTNFGDGGQFELVNGVPVLQNSFDLRFSLAVPVAAECPMPPGGYPIVLYAHGTGGDWRSYLEDGTGIIMAQHCLATMGVDQIFQGTRPGSTPNATEGQIGLLFYNVQNPVAARTNGRQSAIDEVQRARLFTQTHLVVPGSVSLSGSDVLFDSSKLMFFGHSQGGLNGPLFTAIDPSARGGVFSGSGAQIAIGLLDKTEPQPSVSALVSTLLLGLDAADAAELDIFHPGMSLVQALIDVVDPLHYARLQAVDPRPGFLAKSIYMTEGINPDGTGDNYAPPPGIEAHALAIGLPLQLPDQHAVAQLAWGGAGTVTVPAAGLSGDLVPGLASGVLAQWPVPANDDGHFVVFDVPAAREQAARFLQNLAANPHGLVPAP
jgi:hypothetical protein